MSGADVVPLFELRGFTVELVRDESSVPLVEEIDLTVAPGETVCVVGESGSGKSVTFLASLRLLERTAPVILSGQALFAGEDLLRLAPDRLAELWGTRFSMIFQEAMESLNPTRKVASQLIEAYQVTHGHRAGRLRGARALGAATEKALALLDEVGMPDPADVMRKYPHQLSGGMQQRVMIAQALMGDPELLIADEPTTALDVTIQAEILALLRRLQKSRNMACVLITHDMGVASEMADRIAVYYAGQVIEVGPVESILTSPRHAYTKALLECVPRPNVRLEGRMRTIAGSVPAPGTAIAGDRFAPRNPLASARCFAEPPPVQISENGQHLVRSWQPVEVWTQEMVDLVTSWDPVASRPRAEVSDAPIVILDDVNKTYAKGRNAFTRRGGSRQGRGSRVGDGVLAVKDLSVEVYKGEFFGLVGETGSGKSTLGKLVVDLERADPGSSISVAGFDLGSKRSHAEERELRRTIQMIFQNPQDSLDPRRTVAQAIAEPLKALTSMDKAARAARIAEMLDAVGLPAHIGQRHAGELSGGQRQRVAIARALAPSPAVIVADEPTSALDVSVQGQVMNLLLDLQAEFNLTYIFITHNLSLITAVADRAGVMYRGELLEVAPAADLIAHPAHEYTQRLLAANPDPFARVATRGSA